MPARSRTAFELFLLLESNPRVSTFCEYPVHIDIDGESRRVDFWLSDAQSEQFLLIGETAAAATEAADYRDIRLRNVPLADLAAEQKMTK